MKEIVKILTITFLILQISLFGITSLSAIDTEARNTSYDDLVAPCLNNVARVTCSFGISPSGEGTISVSYDGYSASFQKIKVSVVVEKRSFLLFWNPIEISSGSEEWTASSTALDGILYTSFDVPGTGTYRAKFNIEVIGVNGNDNIEDSIDCVYD